MPNVTSRFGPLGPWGWGALLLGGQAATLAIVRAGNRVGYQHLVEPWRLGTEAPPWALAVLGLELTAVLVFALKRWSSPPEFRPSWRLALAVAGFVLTSATLSRSLPVYAAELILATVLQGVHLAVTCCFALSIPSPLAERLARRFGDALPGEGPSPGAPDRLAWGLAVGVVLVSGLLAVVSYQRHPHVPDEVSYLLQARYFALGRLAMPIPPVPEAFNLDLMTYEAARWFSPFPPGWPAILALGALGGVPWVVNPILGGIAVLLGHLLLRELYGRWVARVGTVMLATSPWLLFLSMSFMSHVASLVAAMVAAIAVARVRRGCSLGWAAVGGVAIGIVALIRPLEGVAVALLLGLWSLGARGPWNRLVPASVLTAMTILTGAAVFPYNAAMTGNPRVHPVMEYMNTTFGPGANDLGFGPNRGSGWEGLDPLPGHGPPDVLINANFNLFQVNTELHGWATGSLVLVLLLVAGGRWRRTDWLMLGVIMTVVAVHSLYYFSGGPDFGARYWFLTAVPFVALSARGLASLAAGRTAVAAQGRALAAAGLLTLSAMLVFVPWRASDKYHHYRGMEPGARQLLADPGLRGAVILIRGERHPDYASAAVYNPIDVTAGTPDVLFAWDRGDTTRTRLARAYPDRRFWIVDGPTRTGDGYRVVAGPLDGTELAAP